MNDDQRMKEQKPSDYPRHHDTPRLKHDKGIWGNPLVVILDSPLGQLSDEEGRVDTIAMNSENPR